jgi:glycosyltransferase involved in cell wall biosynthesis
LKPYRGSVGSNRMTAKSCNVTPLICHTEASLGFGGQEIRILTEIAWLQLHGLGALLVCQPQSRLLKEACARNLPALAVRMRSPLDLFGLLRLRRLLKRYGVALVHTHSSIDSWLGGSAARSLGLPVVRSRHVSIPIRRRRALVYRLADCVVTSGAALRAIVIAAGVAPERVVSIPPGVDTKRFHPDVPGHAVRDELNLPRPPTCKVVGLIADVRGSKGHQYFLEAARHVLRVLPTSRFLIVGDGVGFKSVRQRVRDLGLERAVVLTGFRRDIPEVMAALDVLVVPSLRSEGIPQVILQAFAVGRPVVASAVGGIPEVVRDQQTGLLVPPGDHAALASAILSLLQDPSRASQLAQAGHSLVERRYEMDRVMTYTAELYAQLLSKTGRLRRVPTQEE